MSRNRSNDKTLEDFIFLAFAAGAKLIHKRLTDGRLTSNRYVADKRWMGDRFSTDVCCWFKVPINGKNPVSLQSWAEDCEKTGLRWEIRQTSETHYTVFLLENSFWHYDKQIRDFKTIYEEHQRYQDQYLNRERK